jgi:NADPH:quinone reductase-like Zn-dependent oxidoreductase
MKCLIQLSRKSTGIEVDTVAKEMRRQKLTFESVSLADKDLVSDPSAIYVSVVEMNESLFNGGLTAGEFANLQVLVEAATAIFWVTTGDLLGKADPNSAMVMGLGRSLQTEYPQLTFITVDLDHKDFSKGAEQVLSLVGTFSKASEEIDKEYIVNSDIFHVSRLGQDGVLDQEYKQILGREPTLEKYNASKPIQLEITRVGLLDTLHFKEDVRDRSIKPGEAEVEVKAVGLNMKVCRKPSHIPKIPLLIFRQEFATFQGSFHSESLSHEGSGIVRRVGSDVTNVKVGDRVCYMGKGLFGNFERFKAQHLHKIRDSDSYEDTASMPLAFSTAVYGLLHLGRLKKGETVLIHSATGGVGLAAIQVAQMVGAEIFATVGTDDKREFLKTHYNLDDAHIYNSRDTAFAAGILEATGGRGIDVSLNSLVRELLKASWSIMANNGRHIEIGRTDILDYGSLDLNVFKRNTTFSAFDFGIVADEHPEIPTVVMKEVMQYYEAGLIRPLDPLYVYPATQIVTAFQQFGNANRIGKVVVSFGETGSAATESSNSDEIEVSNAIQYISTRLTIN